MMGVNALGELQSAGGEELSHRDASQSALILSVPYIRVSASVTKTSPKTQREY